MVLGPASEGHCRTWNPQQLRAWLIENGLGEEYATVLEQQDIGGETFLSMSKAELKGVGITKFGPLKKAMLLMDKLLREAGVDA